MEDVVPYLSNMSAPPKTVVTYSGLATTVSLKTCQGYWAKGQSVGGALGPAGLFGTPVRFVLPPNLVGKKPITILRRLGVKPSGDHEQQLLALINARADELPLPDGCVVIRRTEAESEIWKDPLTVLAVLTKCSDVIWLRSKHPALQAAFERGAAATLLVPPLFAARLPAQRHREEADEEAPNRRHRERPGPSTGDVIASDLGRLLVAKRSPIRGIASGPARTKGPSQ